MESRLEQILAFTLFLAALALLAPSMNDQLIIIAFAVLVFFVSVNARQFLSFYVLTLIALGVLAIIAQPFLAHFIPAVNIRFLAGTILWSGIASIIIACYIRPLTP